MNKLLQQFLTSRGINAEMFANITNYEIEHLHDVDKFADIIYKYKMSQELIVIIPDFDMDGIMSGVLGFAGLTELGLNVALYAPDSSTGYGFGKTEIDEIMSLYPNVKAILTCDVGITCYAGVDYAYANGIESIITDHHMQKEDGIEGLKNASVVVNPNKLEDDYSLKGICGVHVLWQCLCEYAEAYEDTFMRSQMRNLSVFAGIGTMSDAMPIIKENRPLVEDSINVCRLLNTVADNSLTLDTKTDYEIDLSSISLTHESVADLYLNSIEGSYIYKRAFYGLYIAINQLHTLSKASSRYDISKDYFDFSLIPMFNSVKRLGKSSTYAFNVFFGDSARAMEELYELHVMRKELTKEYFKQLMEGVELGTHQHAPYLYEIDAYSGFMGLLANNMLGVTELPAFVVNPNVDPTTGFLHGSCRTPAWFSMITFFSKDDIDPNYIGNFKKDYVTVAGHENACGFKVQADKRSEFIDYLEFLINRELDKLGEDAKMSSSDVVVDVKDHEITIETVIDFIDSLDAFRPFGQGFKAPVIEIPLKREDVMLMAMSEGKHIRINVSDNLSIISWNAGDQMEGLSNATNITCKGTFSINNFRDRISVQLIGDITHD